MRVSIQDEGAVAPDGTIIRTVADYEAFLARMQGSQDAGDNGAPGGPELRVADKDPGEPSAPPRLYGADLMAYRIKHGGKLPPAQAAEVEAREAAYAEGRGLYGGALMMHRIKTGYFSKKENQG